jgi:hypothetical protein
VKPPPEIAEIVVPAPLVPVPSINEVAAQPVFDAAAASAAGMGRDCEIGDALARAFTGHPLLRQALADWSPVARSVSGAIMLWDGEWVAPEDGIPPESLALIQRGVIEGIKAAPEECLDAPVIGPRFVIVPSESARSTVLVLGSGAWNWRHILDYEEERLLAAPPVPQKPVIAANM